MKQMLKKRQPTPVQPKPMTQSERAKLQPRDEKGRFAGFDTVMVVDEFGNIGKDPKRSETTFGYAVSVTEQPDLFGAITDDNRWRSSKEKKARNDADNRNKITSRIAGKGVRTYAYYVDKNDPPKEWSEDDRRDLMLRILSYSVDETLPETRGNVYVVVDHHNSYKGSVRPMIQKKSRPWKVVDGDKYDSYEGECADILQTHDYVASAARANVELGDAHRSKKLRMKIHKIRNGDLHD